jgi:2-keto-4-pentenoate hydratase/2-oxohepta-3-ene-1,7-dioic acid hydratase in catechol pathway
MQQQWVRFREGDAVRFGTLEGERVRLWHGDLFEYPQRGDRTIALAEVQLLTPVQPSKVIAMWNNFHALAAKLELPDCAEPLYLVKTPNAYLEPGGTIRHPGGGAKVVFEGELGIVIGRRATQVSEREALQHVFGYTCANDVTVADILNRDASFAQWTRAKGFDTFCAIGNVGAVPADLASLRLTTRVNGTVRQQATAAEMVFDIPSILAFISHVMTLEENDLVLTGTPDGVGTLASGDVVEVEIDGVSRVSNPVTNDA